MWGGPGLRLHATSHWHCGEAAMTLVRAWLRGSLGEGWRKMYVKIMCLQDALYKAIKLSVSKTVHRGYNLCLWQPKIHFSCLFHCELYQWVVSFVGVHSGGEKKFLIHYFLLKPLKRRHDGLKWYFHSGKKNEIVGILHILEENWYQSCLTLKLHPCQKGTSLRGTGRAEGGRRITIEDYHSG